MKKLLSLALCAATLLIVAPASASAALLCVNTLTDPGCDGTYSSAQLQMALNDAAANGTSDVVHLGPGTYAGEFDYSGTSEPVVIEGESRALTQLDVPSTAGGTIGLKLNGGPGVTVQDLSVRMSATNSSSDRAIESTAATLRRATIIGNGSDNSTGIIAFGGSIANVTVDLGLTTPSGTRGILADGDMSIRDSIINGSDGINFSGPNTTLDISRVAISASARAVYDESGTVNIDDSLIDLGSFAARGLNAENGNNSTVDKAIHARHVTIVGGGPNSFGIRATAAASGALQHTMLTFDDSIISGPEVSIQRFAGNNGGQGGPSVANVTTDHSNYDASTVADSNSANGSGAVTATSQTNLPPGFVDAAGGDFRLAANSALVDAGNPAGGGPGTDLLGNSRLEDGDGDFVVRRDLGAYEVADTLAPPVQITSGPPATTADPVLTFNFSSPDPAATFTCRIDSAAFAPCTTPSSYTVTAGDGVHTFEVRAADHAANSSTATRTVTVDTSTPPTETPPGDTPPGDTPPQGTPPADTKAPKTTIAAAPKVKTTKRRVRLNFTADEPSATFECSLDAGAFAPCSSPYQTPKLKRGKHTLTVRATDPAGNVETTPPSVKIKVKRKPRG